MKIEAVSAHAFGPFVGETLSFAPGLSVIWGPNEAGKSSWHAALYFGLCGRRRGGGQPSREERELRARHEPWDGGRWEVGATIQLEDGRRVELRHDLQGLVNCRARDIGLGGRDCSDEIVVGNDAPDGARWLGLDRRTFLAVACVRQGDLLAVRQNGGLIQEHLQRGAATGGADETAALALDRIDQFRRDRVGASHRAAIGPLRRATIAVEQAESALHAAQTAHASYAALRTQLGQLEEAEGDARAVLYRTEVARTRIEASPSARALQDEADAARTRVASASARRISHGLLLVAMLCALLGAGLGALAEDRTYQLLGAGLLLLSCGLALLGVGRRDGRAIARAVETLRATEAAIAADREARILAAHEAQTVALRAYEAAARAAAELRAQIEERMRGLPSVAEAEETLASAVAERARVAELDRVLELTRSFLLRAQERVHRGVAPRLASQVSTWLPRVTANRYTQALVDPASLAVGVRTADGPWRDAALLSHGTAEQVYLLLRVALADQLTRPGEVCPLILDDPTPHFDADRTEAMLDLLLQLAESRQIVLFSQESAVLSWAERRLVEPRHRVWRLSGTRVLV